MKNLAIAMLIFLTCAISGCAQDKQSVSAKEFVSQLAKGDFTAATGNFDPQMKAAASPDRLKEIWDSLVAQYGPFKNQVRMRKDKLGAYDVVYVTCQFERYKTDLKVVFDSEGRISGLWIVPTPNDDAFKTPAYVKPGRFREQDVIVRSAEWKLPGILAMPGGKGPFPAVVLVHGSGPNDRDETIGSNKPFKDIAQGLASSGIAALRYDKRTKAHPADMAKIKDLTVKEEVIDDALAAVSLLRKTNGIDAGRIYVLGHSLGGMLIPRIGARDPKIAGLISLAGCTRPLEDVIVEQMTYLLSLDKNTLESKKNAKLDEVKRQAAQVKSAGASSGMIFGVPPSYWIDLRGYDPPHSAKMLAAPMFILQGGRDYQVTTVDFSRWKSALSSKKNTTFKLYPDLNHLFMKGSGKSTPQEYEVPGHVSEEVIDDIAAWVKR
ncbi:DUF3887 domain-containing protein [bacterium]|nr:DUF3887 domain-containing protein [bacterium]